MLARILLDFALDAGVVGVLPLQRGDLLLDELEGHKQGRHYQNLQNHAYEHAAD